MKIKKYIQNILYKYIGKKEYVVTAVSVDGEVKHGTFFTIKEVDDFVNKINVEKYYDVQKIEKIRKCHFKYNKEIIHSPLWFSLENVTEDEFCVNHEYSFLKKHESLQNVKRVCNKN
jgi:hypothetical protein